MNDEKHTEGYKKWLAKVESDPKLISLLYDVNLLPEQINTERDATLLKAIVYAFFTTPTAETGEAV